MSSWHKSTYSGKNFDCVEVRETPITVDVRDTQNRDAGYLSFPTSEWSAFLRDVQAGEL